jgi:hypothetical protein
MKYSLRSLMTFSIRDLFWLMVVAAVLAVWSVDHRRQDARLEGSIRRMSKTIKELDDELFWHRPSGRVPIKGPLPKSPAPAPNPPKP